MLKHKLLFLCLPFHYVSILRRHLLATKTVLDVGCGDGSLMDYLNDDRIFKVTGVDLFVPYIEKAKTRKCYQKVLRGDIRKLRFVDQFDAVLCSQVIEHLSLREGQNMLSKMEKLARKRVIIATPNGFLEQHEYDQNPHQVHHSGWNVADFEKRGYRVFGQGAKVLFGEKGLVHEQIVQRISLLRYFLWVVSWILGPYIYFHPEQAAYLIAIKDKKGVI